MGLVISPISGVYKHIHSFGQLKLISTDKIRPYSSFTGRTSNRVRIILQQFLSARSSEKISRNIRYAIMFLMLVPSMTNPSRLSLL